MSFQIKIMSWFIITHLRCLAFCKLKAVWAYDLEQDYPVFKLPNDGGVLSEQFFKRHKEDVRKSAKDKRISKR